LRGDHTRRSFDPFKDYSGVVMQQGRVLTDSDWNEQMAILGRRLRALIVDTIGAAIVPTQTPRAFAIDFSAGVPRIGAGRMYVHGLLVENHGNARPDAMGPAHSHLEFDPVLGELRGPDPVPYTEQRYFPNVASLAPFPTAGGPHLVYLDVWQREVTALEDPDLCDVAEGVDTSTREQTVWQVRVLRDVSDGTTCASPDTALNGWAIVTSPSAGRLTTGVARVSGNEDPRLVPPRVGYTGLENQLYRVEIHDAGSLGLATFKWLRDGTTVATSVVRLPDPKTLVVGPVHGDRIVRFSPGDWVEAIDDWREFAGLPGVMAQVENVEEATRTITLMTAIPAGMFDVDAQGAVDPARHTRIQRWESPGILPVPADGVPLDLADGVRIAFSTQPVGGEYQVGDYWTFAARTANASVEVLREAAPQGIHHHFARLALVTLPHDVQDCRSFWPPGADRLAATARSDREPRLSP
jgi:hypothetical protein